MGLIGNIYGLLGYYCHVRDKLDKAMRFYEKGMAHDMTKPSYKLAYGVLLLKSGQFQKARDIFSSVLIDPRYKDSVRNMAKLNLSLAYWKLGDIDTAIEMLRELHRKQRTSRIYETLGYLLIEKGNLDEALKYNLEAVKYDAEDPVILDNLAQTYYMMGKLKEAKRYFEKAESLKEDQVSTLYYLGCIYQQEGNLQAAKEKLEKALGCNINPLSTISREAIQQKLEEINHALQSSSLK
ncbi:MAG: tetratricopeptide repeat protein [Caldicoprobacter oshimai]|nr:MAG: hypothetical protein DIU64_09915 [Caldicoprobacter oshimai]